MIRYLAAHTRVPVPQIYLWNSDGSNPAGVEYMIMQKVVILRWNLLLSLISLYCTKCLEYPPILS
jgi:hypothetical protein